ncbi:nicotinate-nucleotide--dimethylbenzimidazole phosphoribosyltransferase, partial [Pseudomonas quasicaspiana]|nr:nicotinate-nucleotide--dimethylbenzimidazole phosphoribosyltransferase [Pseudomonas quasicaspiana]
PAQAINVPVREEALARQQQLTKPTGSLGQLERVAVQLPQGTGGFGQLLLPRQGFFPDRNVDRLGGLKPPRVT